MPVRAVIFDFNGTLSHDERGLASAEVVERVNGLLRGTAVASQPPHAEAG